MFKDFNISSFKKMKPPGDNTFDTSQEIKALKKIPLNKKFVKDYDNIEKAFAKTAKVLGDKYPKAKSAFAKTGENISYSRNVARAHYKSDSKMGEKLANAMYKHIKNKI